MTALEQIRSEINELKKYREILCMIFKEDSLSQTEKQEVKDKPKVKKLEVRKNDRI